MPNIKRGKIDFDKKYVALSLGTEERVVIYDCSPPPRGTRDRSSPETTVAVEIIPDFLQARGSERRSRRCRAPPSRARR